MMTLSACMVPIHREFSVSQRERAGDFAVTFDSPVDDEFAFSANVAADRAARADQGCRT